MASLAFEKDRGSIAVSAGGNALGVLISRILGLARDMAIARYIDTNTRDAFLSAFRLANIFRRLFGEGALSVSFVPVIGEILGGAPTPEKTDRAREFISAVFTLLLILTLTTALLCELFLPPILGFLLDGSGFSSVPGKLEMAIAFARWILIFPIFASFFGLFMAIHHSHRRFLLPAMAPALFNLVMVIAAVMGAMTGISVARLGAAVVVGGFVQMAVLIPGVVKMGLLPRLSARLASADLIRFLKVAAPGFFALSVFQLKILVNIRFASLLPPGSQSYLYLAERLLEVPIGLFVVSLSTALLPTLAGYHARGERDLLAREVNHALRLVLFIAWPAALGLFVLSTPIVETLFLGREFHFSDSAQTIQLIKIFSVTIVLVAAIRILAQGFYAIGNTWFPAFSTAVSLVSHVIFAFVLVRVWGLNGLAVASVGSMTVNLVLLTRGHIRWVAPLEVSQLLRGLVSFIVCSVVMVAVALTYEPVRQTLGAHSTVAKALVLGVIIGLAIAAYLGAAHVLRVPEYQETLRSLRRRFQSSADNGDETSSGER